MAIIDIVFQQLNKAKTKFDFLTDWATAMTVVFVVAMIGFNSLFLNYLTGAGRISGLDFPATDFIFDSLYRLNLSFTESKNSIEVGLGEEDSGVRFVVLDKAAFLNSGNPLSNIVPTREGLIIYKIQKGDNLSRIAANFGISLNTILWANSNLKTKSLQPGQEIVILPTSGVLHQVQEEESLESISSKYGVAVQRILSANPTLTAARLLNSSTIIIPDSRPIRSEALAALAALPNLVGYFAIPTTGWNWGRLHPFNGVDIANACGTPIYAAAEGLVAETANGWNEGYGNYIMLEHPNGTKTRYAHNQRNLVAIGDYVLKGDQIAIIGNTGLTYGPTGCHLHFEVKGAKNPFSK